MMTSYLNKCVLYFLLLTSCTVGTTSNSKNIENKEVFHKYNYYNSLLGKGIMIEGYALDSCVTPLDSINIISIKRCFLDQKLFKCLGSVESIVLTSCWTNEEITIDAKEMKDFHVGLHNTNANLFILNNVTNISISSTNILFLDNKTIKGKPKSIHLLNVYIDAIKLSSVNTLEIYDSVVDSIKINNIDTLIMDNMYKKPILEIPKQTVVIYK